MDTVDFMRGAAFWAAAVAVILLLSVELLLRCRVRRAVYHWLLLIGLFALPLFSVTATTGVILEQSKTVDSCASCHSMDPFISDLRNPSSTTLAARHYRNKWIPHDQCYECHTTYGLHGMFDAKLDGMRHWWKYVTDDWKRPISYLGEYPNSNCLECHGGTPAYENAGAHLVAFKALKRDVVLNCMLCHGPPHPTSKQRKNEPADE